MTIYFEAFQQQLIIDGDYQDPISESFIRNHEEPGRSWNMEAWKVKRKKQQLSN